MEAVMVPAESRGVKTLIRKVFAPKVSPKLAPSSSWSKSKGGREGQDDRRVIEWTARTRGANGPSCRSCDRSRGFHV